MPKRPIQNANPGRRPLSKAELDAMMAKQRGEPRAIRTLRCRNVARGRFTQRSYIRDLPPQSLVEREAGDVSDEDIAPSASEALLAAFGSCLAVGIDANAVARHIPVRRRESKLDADINSTAVWGTGDIEPKPIGFEAVRVAVRIEANPYRDSLDAFIKHATLWSPVANTLHNPVHPDVAPAQEDVEGQV